MWFGCWELARVNCRNGPKCASTGLAQDAFVGVKHRLTLLRLAQCWITDPLWAERLSRIT